MNLPDIHLQSAALAIGWAIVIACLLVEMRVRLRAGAKARTLAIVALVPLAAVWLPGEASPAFWLGLAFQWPSTLLVLLAAARLWQRLRAPGRSHGPLPVEEPLLPLRAALPLAGAGILLYLGTFGVGPFVYRSGYTDTAVLLFVTLAMGAWRWGRPPMPRTSLLFALAIVVHLLTRLPTGNAWDALIDPFVMLLAIGVCVRSMRSARRTRLDRALEPSL